jgi:pimeloyl-ACP methyl ester carboxylesterase
MILLFGLLAGCQSSPPRTGDVILFSPGVAGDGPWFSRLRGGLRQGGIDRPMVSIHWGAPPPLFMFNYTDTSIHDTAEREMAERILAARKNDPTRQIDLIGHSAGCGVVLGALRRLPAEVRVRTVILLAPSVSPQYDLHASLDHVDSVIHAFISDRDTVFLKWRDSHFGGYDNIKSPAAGYAGFDLSNLDPAHRAKLIEHLYQPEWKDLGNDGGHIGATASGFAAKVLAPLLK